MENDNVKEGSESWVWVLIQYSQGMSLNKGLYPIGVFETRERAEQVLARVYIDARSEYDDGDIPDLFFIEGAPFDRSFQTPLASIASSELKSNN